ncbi:GNAT family N-acetyltransferase [Fibrella sp. HMF5405]|uniref:GNAT family N-acetyltransferase n=1 Tax=Fibrella forsythiae TaxID=2817061 RepID=A0ABS3JPP9_9BACT|nr:GNAT family N-acetyltransferase [Fibrella forsythiae]
MLETDRLVLRRLATSDAPFIVELVNSPGWLKNIGDRQIRTVAQAETYLLNGPLASYEANGFGLYLIERKVDQTPIGMCGIIKRDTLETPDIGFALLPDYAGKGYAFEIAEATIDYATHTLNIPVISGIVLPANEPSIKLLKKIGLTFRQMIQAPTTNEELMLFDNQRV